MKYKAYNAKHEKNMEDVITLLDEHPKINQDDFLTTKIMQSVNHLAKNEVPKKRKPFTFEMKLAGSLICSGVLILVNNVITLGKDLYFNEGVMKTIDSLNHILSDAINRLGRY
ncbi:hypothetical protein HZI73_01130 [Vallitalea pronyensis]|uniref:Uncharacterized protein n=1 Tax=Vallitalea pronyensis TaxID=1348613 RepID=A0A8J8SF24_9FIRM|nr:hypothetical protein [Vallitalea pronyensis]QUI20982.1 hypothetical protein HZI73_01130 [Vallitalea pronyensis]